MRVELLVICSVNTETIPFLKVMAHDLGLIGLGPDLADEGDITALAFPGLQFSIWVSLRPRIEP